MSAPATLDPQELLSKERVKKILHIGDARLRSMGIPAVNLGGRICFRRETVEKYLADIEEVPEEGALILSDEEYLRRIAAM